MEVTLAIIFIAFIYKWQKVEFNVDLMLGNLLFYPAALSVLYLLLPYWLHIAEITNLLVLESGYIEWVSDIALYYVTVFWLFFIFSKSCNYRNNNLDLPSINLRILKIILIIFSLLIFLIILITIDQDIMYADRVGKYLYYAKVLKFPGFTLLSWFLVIWVYVLIFYTRNLSNILYLLPLVILELICSSRYYILVAAAICLTYIVGEGRKKLGVPLLGAILTFAVIGSFRDGVESYMYLNFLVASSGEFINTWYATYIVWANNITSQNSALIVLINHIIPSNFTEILKLDRSIYTDRISNYHSFEFGMGSSAIAEGFSYDIIYLYPILVSLSLMLINKIRFITCNVGVLRLLSIIFIYSVFRGGAVNNIGSMIMVYGAVFLFPYYLFTNKNIWRLN